MKLNNNSGYSTIVAIFLTGFLLILTVGILNLLLNDMWDTKGHENYHKTFYGAEGSAELALLSNKNYSNGNFINKIEANQEKQSIILSKNPLDKTTFLPLKDLEISYNIDYKTKEIQDKLESGNYNIIPLFYIDENNIEQKIKEKLELSLLSGDANNISWNIIGNNSGITGIGIFNENDNGIKKTIDTNIDFSLSLNTKIKDFLNSSNKNYLIVFNSGNSLVEYKLKTSTSNLEYFTKSDIKIEASSKIKDYKQNIYLKIDSKKSSNLLKYSIYSK